MKVNNEVSKRVNNLHLDKNAEYWLTYEMRERLGNAGKPLSFSQLFRRQVVAPSVTRMVAQRHPLDFVIIDDQYVGLTSWM